MFGFTRNITNSRFIDDSDFVRIKMTKKVNDFALVKKIGSGSSSKVFLAIDAKTKKQYAVKEIKIGSGPEMAYNIEREIRNMRKLNSNHIIKLIEVLHCKRTDTAYLVLERAPLGSLQDLIDRYEEGEKVPKEPIIAGIFRDIVDAIRYLHSQGIVHHDIKPANILLFNNKAKLADFGIGHSFQSTNSVVGTPAFQAPEFLDDNCSYVDCNPAEEDVWSLGVTLFYTVFGYLPFQGDNLFEIAHLIQNSKLEIPGTASKELRDLISRMLEVNPHKRITMEEVSKHPFLCSAPHDFVIETNSKELNLELPSSNSMVDIKAEVCDDNHCFARTQRSSSWPGNISCF